MELIYTILAFLLLVGIVVTIHEAGHFFTAIYSGMRVMEFSVGFGPKILQKRIGKDQVLFTLRLLPLGGYVKPLDESLLTKEEWLALPESEKQRSFMNSSRWKKAAMVAGGPLSNFVLAFVLFFFAFTIIGTQGLPPIVGEVIKGSIFEQSGINKGDVIKEVNGRPVNFTSDTNSIIANAAISGETLTIVTEKNTKHTADFKNLDLTNLNDDLGQLTGMYFQGQVGPVAVKKVFDDGSAAKAGLQSGDIITAINGMKVEDLNKTLRTVRGNPGTKFEFTYVRNGVTSTKMIESVSTLEGGFYIGKIGVELESVGENQFKVVHHSVLSGLTESVNYVATSTWTNIVSIKKLITGELSTKALSGPLSIADYSGKSAKKGLYTYVLMMAAISIAVGVFNLLPIPMLDGGYLLQYAIEGVIGKGFTTKQLSFMHFIGIAVMTSLFIFAIGNDINKYLGFLG
jgi:regulator of sigma E protease